MLSTLLRIPKDLVCSVVEEVQLLANKLPILGILVLSLITLLIDQRGKKVAFLLTPVIGGKVDLLEAEPFEHARLASDPWDQRRDHFPILTILY